jgi:hypothetical protein
VTVSAEPPGPPSQTGVFRTLTATGDPRVHSGRRAVAITAKPAAPSKAASTTRAHDAIHVDER